VLNKLISKCKCGVHVAINVHKDNYMSVSEYMEESDHISDEDILYIGENVLNQMIAKDTIVHLYYYLDTPVGYNEVYHYDINSAVKIALERFDK